MDWNRTNKFAAHTHTYRQRRRKKKHIKLFIIITNMLMHFLLRSALPLARNSNSDRGTKTISFESKKKNKTIQTVLKFNFLPVAVVDSKCHTPIQYDSMLEWQMLRFSNYSICSVCWCCCCCSSCACHSRSVYCWGEPLKSNSMVCSMSVWVCV